MINKLHLQLTESLIRCGFLLTSDSKRYEANTSRVDNSACANQKYDRMVVEVLIR